MRTKNSKVYKITDKRKGIEYIGTAYELEKIIPKGNIGYIVEKKETKRFKSELLGYRAYVYKIFYKGQVYEGQIEELNERLGFHSRTIEQMYYRQKCGLYTSVRIMDKKEIIKCNCQ